MAGRLGSNVVPVAADLVDIPHMPGWPALLVLIVVLLVVGLRNPYRKMMRDRTAGRGRGGATGSSGDAGSQERR